MFRSLAHRWSNISSCRVYMIHATSEFHTSSVVLALRRRKEQPIPEPSFTAVIIGRPNVGKSTLFNRLVGRKTAIVHNTSGVTRDRQESLASLGDLSFTLVDTAGLDDKPQHSLEGKMLWVQALSHANLALMCLDARVGITDEDAHFARWFGIPSLLIMNKVDHESVRVDVDEALKLGLGKPILVSAEHGDGLADLYLALRTFAVSIEALKEEQEVATESFSETESEMVAAETDIVQVQADIDNAGDVVTSQLVRTDDEETYATESVSQESGEDNPDILIDKSLPVKVAIVGRPNVGKSTLINRIIKQERLLTGPEPGVTRTSVSVPFTFQGREVILMDTAGLRAKNLVQSQLELLAAQHSVRATKHANVVVLVLNLSDPKSATQHEIVTHQELTIAALAEREGRAMVVACNKWDLVSNEKATLKYLREKLNSSFHQMRDIPIVPVSALRGDNVSRLLRAVLDVHERWSCRVSTGRLNTWLARHMILHKPPVRIRYVTQVKTRPPTFAVFAGKRQQMPETYMRHLVSALREEFQFQGVPIRLLLRGSDNPYKDKPQWKSDQDKKRRERRERSTK